MFKGCEQKLITLGSTADSTRRRKQGELMKMKLALFAAIAVTATGVTAGPAQANPVTSSGNAVIQSAHKGYDDDPHLQLSPAEEAGEAAKFASAEALLARPDPKPGTLPSVCPISDPCGPPPTSYSLGGRQQPQQTSYWCGPAAVSEALAHQSVSLSQTNTATQLKTNTTGTAWSGVYVSTSPSTGYAVADLLNNRLASQGVKYYSIAVGSPTGTDISNLATRVRSDIYWGVPLVNDAWETANSAYHLVGHPTDRTIYHWFTTYAYSSSGSVITYEDSAKSSYVSWGAGVPAYSSLSATAIAHIVGGRGYVW